MKRVVLDTNFLVSAAKYRIPLKAEIGRVLGAPSELFLSEKVIEELSQIASAKKKDSPAAHAALDFLADSGARIVPTSQPVDPWILESAARDREIIVATNDRELCLKLRHLKVRVLTIKGKSKLGFM